MMPHWKNGSAIPVIACKDSVRSVTEDGNEALERIVSNWCKHRRPFTVKFLLPAFNIDYKEKFTDEATVVESFRVKSETGGRGGE